MDADLEPQHAVDRVMRRAAERITRVDVHQAAELHRAGALFVDTRSYEQRRRFGMVPGAVVVERNVLEWRLDPASPHRHERVVGPDQDVVLYCQQGYGSVLAVAGLVDMGIDHVVELRGGMDAWIAAGLPVEPAPRFELDADPA